MRGTRRHGLYHLDASPVVHHEQITKPDPDITSDPPADSHAASTRGKTIDINLMHRRLGHLNFNDLRKMVRDGQISAISDLSGSLGVCEASMMGKMNNSLSNRRANVQNATGIDSCGPHRTHKVPRG